MQTSRLIKAIQKVGIEIKDLSQEIRDWRTGEKKTRREYVAYGPKYKVHWYDQEGSAICVSVRTKNEHIDCSRDYFPGRFAHTIKDAVKSLQEA